MPRAPGSATDGAPARGGEDAAIAALAAGARTLSLAACCELARALVEHVIVESQNHAHDLSPYAAIHQRFAGALRAVAETVGHAPTTGEYQGEYERRRDRGDSGLPSLGAICRHFGGWPQALIAAGLIPPAPPSAFRRRRGYRRRQERYTDHRLRHCLQVCAEQVERTPMVRDYIAWREELLADATRQRSGRRDIPHHRTYYERYGNWDAALADAGLPTDPAARIDPATYSPLT